MKNTPNDCIFFRHCAVPTAFVGLFVSTAALAGCDLPVFQGGRLTIPAVQVISDNGDVGLYKANLDYLPMPATTNDFRLASGESANPVGLIVTTIPTPLRVGEQGYLQVQLIPSMSIASATLFAASTSDAVEITPSSMALTNLVPPSSGSAPGKSPPDPPALGVVPVVNFQVKVLRAGIFPATIEFRADCGTQKRQITIKGE